MTRFPRTPSDARDDSPGRGAFIPQGQLAEAYGLRWTIETCFKHLKTTMKMDVLRCQTVAGVLKELTMFLLVRLWFA